MVKVGCCGFPVNKKEYFKKFSFYGFFKNTNGNQGEISQKI
jgi:hypothetical protein